MIVSIDAIDALLPQTQCTKCGYKDCYDYAKAITNGEKHNRCPPGGEITMIALSTLLKRPQLELDTTCGIHQPRKVAVINEDLCIGCTKCILACPVDAIIGSGKLMHTVIEQDCSGCDLCVEPCPMDCIDMIELPFEKQPNILADVSYSTMQDAYRQRHQQRNQRIEEAQKLELNKHRAKVSQQADIDKKAYIAEALKAFRNKKKNINHE